MKKFLASGIFILFFAVYALFQNSGGNSVTFSSQNTYVGTKQTGGRALAQAAPPPKTSPVSTTPVQKTTPAPTPVPAPKPKGQYIDGTYTGSVADAYYGNVQVEVSVSGGKIADVQFLQYPNDRNTSRYINGQAMPILRSEAIQAQSANVSGVSGASDTSAAFQESLASALSQAKA